MKWKICIDFSLEEEKKLIHNACLEKNKWQNDMNMYVKFTYESTFFIQLIFN